MKRARRGKPKNSQTQAASGENKSDERRKLRSASQAESSDDAKTTQKHINLTRFIFKNKEDRPEHILKKTEHDSDDFETPVKQIKRAPKLSQPAVTNRNGATNRGNPRKTKRQQKITTAFLRSEQMFSEVAAQHALADNLNPDDVQLALALSRSELETNIENSQEIRISDDGVEVQPASTEESIRSKLQKFGYRTGSEEVYNHCFAAAFLNNQRRTKTKWANKFTALTLRDPKIQNRKVNANIEAILKSQFGSNSTEDCASIGLRYQMQSNFLSQHVVMDEEDALHFRDMETLSTADHLERFFVADLFPVTHLPSGHLLKDWTTIAGRDLSPERDKCKRLDSEAVKRRYEYFYNELEAYFSCNRNKNLPEKEPRATTSQEIKFKASIEATSVSQVGEGGVSIIENSSEIVSTQTNAVLGLETALDRISYDEDRAIGSPQMVSTAMEDTVLEEKSFHEERFSVSQESQHKKSTAIEVCSSDVSIKHTQKALESDSSKGLRNEQRACASETFGDAFDRNGPRDCMDISKSQTRPKSPDLFADSDSDCAEDVESNKRTDITTYEVYSSDEVKTSCEVLHRSELLSVKADNIVDLTQGSDELTSPKHKKQNISKRLDFLDIPKEIVPTFSSEICSMSDDEMDVLQKEDTEPFNSSIANVDRRESNLENDDAINEVEDCLFNQSGDTIKDKEERPSIADKSEKTTSPVVPFLDIPSIYYEKNAVLPKEPSICCEPGIEPLNDSIADIDLTQSDQECDNGIRHLEDCLFNKSRDPTKDKEERPSIADKSQKKTSPAVQENSLHPFLDMPSIYYEKNAVLPKEPSLCCEPGIEPLNDSIADIDLTQSDQECDNGIRHLEDCLFNKSRDPTKDKEKKLSAANRSQNKMSPAVQGNDLEIFSDTFSTCDRQNEAHTEEPPIFDELGIEPLNDSIDDIDLTQSDHEGIDGHTDDEDVCILLSDDEVNYSIKKANRTSLKPNLSSSQSSLASSCASERSFKKAEENDDDDGCILLSDDEVNYSIKNANRKSLKMQLSSLQSHRSSSHLDENRFNESDEDYEELENRFQKAVEHNFSVLDLIDIEKSFRVNEKDDEMFPRNDSFDLSGDEEPVLRESLPTQENVKDLPLTPIKEVSISEMQKKQRAEFGILESQSETFSPTSWMKTPVKVTTPSSSYDNAYQMKRFSVHGRSSRNFQSFLYDLPTTSEPPPPAVIPMEFDDFDEFDRLVYGSPRKHVWETQPQGDVPAGLSQLLTAEISFNARGATATPPSRKFQRLSVSPSPLRMVGAITPEKVKNHDSMPCGGITTPEKTKKRTSSSIGGLRTPEKTKKLTSFPFGGIISPEKAKGFTYEEEEVTVNDHVYIVRRTNSPEPNFSAQTDDELTKQLTNYGIKPLKRNLAIKFLKYIYDETHPLVETEPNENDQTDEEAVCNKKGKKGSKPQLQNQTKKFDLEDCTGDKLLRYTTELCAELRDGDEEVYIFQTNVRKNTQHPLLPLHIAWFNLVCSNAALHESMLMYEAIDLQEIFLFFKSIGYRYDPKELKSFFDRRCIIFRYDLNPPEKPGNRYTKKAQKKTTTASQKLANSQQIKNSQKPNENELTQNSQKPAKSQQVRRFKKYTSSQQTRRPKKIPPSQPTLQKYLSL